MNLQELKSRAVLVNVDDASTYVLTLNTEDSRELMYELPRWVMDIPTTVPFTCRVDEDGNLVGRLALDEHDS